MVLKLYPKWLLIAAVSSSFSTLCYSKDELKIGGQVFELEPFVIYESPIPVIDGMTGEKYTGTNPLVLDFAESFNDLLLKYHRQLLVYEIQHLDFRLKDGVAFEKDLRELAESFGIKSFRMRHENWLRREVSIVTRLNEEPFFKIEELIVWHEDQLNDLYPTLPLTKHAKDIRFNEEKNIWERRVTTDWVVAYRTYNNKGKLGKGVRIEKQQGLNLDTQKGYHILNRGLTAQVPPHAFKDVKFTYPIIINSKEDHEIQLKRLKETYAQNLMHIYDPFSWMARRNSRFRGGFARDLENHLSRRSLKVSDNDWFEPVLCNFLNDIITIKRHGKEEIYNLHGIRKFSPSRNVLGKGLDLLNWNKGEKRKGTSKPAAKVKKLNFNNHGDARFIVLDAYMRNKDKFLNTIREKITNLEGRPSGKEIFKSAIEEVSGIPFKIYVEKVSPIQLKMINDQRPDYLDE